MFMCTHTHNCNNILFQIENYGDVEQVCLFCKDDWKIESVNIKKTMLGHTEVSVLKSIDMG